MRYLSYVRLDPTGNITCLVLDEVPAEQRTVVTALLMKRCEQVGYLTRPADPAAAARLEMMGGEFCGNASMAAAAWLARQRGAREETVVPLEVSGARGLVDCRVRPLPDGAFEGTVAMPPVLEVFPLSLDGRELTAVRLEGIVHLILEDQPMEKRAAEQLLQAAARQLPDAAIGLLQWDSAARFMTPLVWVRGSGTLVWETGCGSGSTAVGAWLALRDGGARQEIRQPGGTILVTAQAQGGRIAAVRMTGLVRLGEMEILRW